jgi:hypothetical protein
VHRQLAPHDPRPERLGDGLMAEADAEQGDVAVRADQVDAAPGARRGAGSGRDDDGPRPRGEQLLRLERVVPDDVQPFARKALELLDQVVGEGVVVIDDGDGAKDTSRQRGARARSS